MDREFEGKRVLVTGGTGQLGQVVCGQFLARGASLVVPYLSEQELHSFRAGPGAGHDDVYYVHLDALDAEMTNKAIAGVVERFGAPDAVVHLAGGYAFGPEVAALAVDDMQRMLNINLVTLMNVCGATLPHLLAAGRGRIVTVGARTALEGSANHAAYSAAKAAVLRYTEALAAEVKHKGIGVNCVLPSVIDTPGNRRAMPNANPAHWVAPLDLAEVILFLASPRSRALNGAAIPAYGLV